MTVTSAANVTADAAFSAASFRQVAGSGTTTFTGALATTATEGIEVDGTNFDFNDTVGLTLGNLDVDATGTVRVNGAVTTLDETKGLVTISNGGLLTVTGTGDMALAGAFLQDGAGLVSTAGNVTTTADNITYTTATTLTGPVALSTGAGAGTIAFLNTLNGNQTLGLTADGGNVDFDGIVGGTAPLGAVTVTSAANVTADAAFSAASFRQVAGSGTTTFTGALATTATEGIEVDGTNFDFNDTVGLTLGNLDVDATGTVRVNGAVTTLDETKGLVTISNGGLLTVTGTGDMALAGAFLQDGAGLVSTAGNVTTTADNITYTTATTLTGPVALSTGAGAGTIAFLNTLNGNQTLGLTADGGNIDFDGIVGGTAPLGAVTVTSAANVTADAAFSAASFRQVAGSGTTTFTGALATTATEGIEVDGTNFDFNDTVGLTLGNLDVDATGTVRVNGAVTTLDETKGLVTISNGGLLTVTGTGDMALAGAFLQDGAGLVSTAGNVTTTADNITYTTATTLTGPVALSTGAGAGTIAFLNTLNGNQTLGLTADGGNVDFDGIVGGTAPLGAVTVTSAANVTADAAFSAASFRQVAGSGTTTFTGALATTATEGIEVDGTNFDFNDTVGLTLGNLDVDATGTVRVNGAVTTLDETKGLVTISNGGLLTVTGTGDMALAGAFLQDGAGLVSTAGNVTTTADNITYTTATTLTGPVALSTGAGAGTIAFLNTLNGNQTLGLTADGGNVDFDGIVGGTAPLGAVTVTSAANVTADAAFSAASFRQVAGSGTTTFTGALATTATEGIEVDGTNFDFNDTVGLTLGNLDVDATGTVRVNGAVTTLDETKGLVTISNGGLLTVTGTGDMALAGAFLQDGAGLVSTAGNVTTTADNITYTTATTLTADNVTFDSAGGNITFAGLVTDAANAYNFNLDADTGAITIDDVAVNQITFTRADAGLSLTGDISVDTIFTTSNIAGEITIGDAASVTTSDDDIIFNTNVKGDNRLTLTAGVGNIDFLSTVGATTALSGLSVVSAATLDLDNTVAVDDEGLDLNATTIGIDNTVTTTNGGAVTITNAGVLTIADAANMTLDGGFTVDGAGAVSTQGNITTTADGIIFDGAGTVTIGANDASFDSAGGDIRFDGDVTGDGLLTLTAGSGNIDFTSTIGASGALSGLKVVSAATLDLDAAVAVDDEGLDIDATTIGIDNTVTTTSGGTVTITNAGVLTIGGNVDADGAFVQDGAGTTSLGASITAPVNQFCHRHYADGECGVYHRRGRRHLGWDV